MTVAQQPDAISSNATQSKQLRVCFIGQVFWCKWLDEVLREHDSAATHSEAVSLTPLTLLSSLMAAVRSDVIVRVGFRPGASSWRGRATDAWWRCLRRLAPNQRRVFFWAGTDVLQTVAGLGNGETRSGPFQRAKHDLHLTDAPWLATELATIGIAATVIPIFAGRFQNQTPPSMPARFTVLTYIPDDRHRFYGSSMIVAAAEALPHVEFLVLGGTGKWLPKPMSNLTFLGWQDEPGQFYERASVVVRMVEHDGLSGTVAEALSFGRHVVYSYAVPHCHKVEFGDDGALIAALTQLASATPLPLNEGGWRYAMREFDRAANSHALVEVLRGKAASGG